MRTIFLLMTAAAGMAQNPPVNHDLGYKDTPMLPGLPYHVHDSDRPRPSVVTPAAQIGGAPSDAIVLFNGKDLSKWTAAKRADPKSSSTDEPTWKVESGYMEVVPGKGDIATKEQFGDVQLHVEWAAPAVVKGNSQGRGNSGVFLQKRYEVQVLDSFENPTYADGQAGAIYGQWPPLVNASRKPGDWQTYDIVFEAPKFDGEKLMKPAFITVFHNGVLVQLRREAMGPTMNRQLAKYVPQPAEDSLLLQNHGNPVRYRNIWIRRINVASQP
jgi:hypothetical protein